jgi:hypothetical protein
VRVRALDLRLAAGAQPQAPSHAAAGAASSCASSSSSSTLHSHLSTDHLQAPNQA